MPQYGFAAGSLWSIPSKTNPTPTRYGTLQNVEVDFKSTLKMLYGQNQVAAAMARAEMAISGKGEFAQLVARFYNDIFFGNMSAAATGSSICVSGEVGTVPASSAYTISVTNHTSFTTDLGVIYAATGLPLTCVSSVTAAGQYSVSAGVYTFFSGDASASVLISYVYTATSGETLTISNQQMGTSPVFKLVLGVPYNSQNFNLTLNSCMVDSASITTSLDDFTKQPFTFAAFADASGNVGVLSFAEGI